MNSAVRLRGDEDTELSDICRFVGEHDDDVATRRLDEVDAVGLGRVSTAGSCGARYQTDEVLHEVAVVERYWRVRRHLTQASARMSQRYSRCRCDYFSAARRAVVFGRQSLL